MGDSCSIFELFVTGNTLYEEHCVLVIIVCDLFLVILSDNIRDEDVTMCTQINGAVYFFLCTLFYYIYELAYHP